MIGLCCGEEGGSRSAQTISDSDGTTGGHRHHTFHQPHDHSVFGFPSRRRSPSPPTPSTRNSSPPTSFFQHTKDISPPLIDTLCLKSVGSWSLLVMVPVERSVLLTVSTRARRGRAILYAKTGVLTDFWWCAGI